MSSLPTYAWPFIFAVIAAVAGRLVVGRSVRDDAGSFPGWILYAVAIGCVIIGFAMIWLGQRS